MRLTGNSRLADILANEKGAELVARIAPELVDGPQAWIFRGFTPHQLGFYAEKVLDAEKKRALVLGLVEISRDLPDPMLPREEVVKAVERRGPSRIPIVRGKWWGEGLTEQYGERLEAFSCFPEDVVQLWLDPTPFHRMGLSWELPQSGAYDNRPILDDWAKLDELIEKLPDPENDGQLEWMVEATEDAHRAGTYVLLSWWQLFFEKPWAIRGMENIMLDYYSEPDNVMRLHRALADQYLGYIRRAARLFQPDGFFTSDDLGHQNGPMIGPDTFREFMFPYYAEIGEALREHGMHFWLHSCGDNTRLLDQLIAVGVDVLHPIQKHCMDERAIADEFGGRISFLAGIDVQHTLQEKDPEGVRREVRFLMDTFDGPDGGMCIGAGNGIVSGTPLENIEAFLDESLRYGEERRRRSP
jgi:uroporphyrinogen decarboxylase